MLSQFGVSIKKSSAHKNLTKIRTAFSVLFLVVLVFSIFFESFEADHECTGDDCAICFVILLSEINIKLFAIALALLSLLTAYNSITNIKNQLKKLPLNKSQTLISLKIRLNN